MLCLNTQIYSQKFKLYFVIIFFSFISCQDEFLLESIDYNPVMVVDGLITNKPRPYEIKLNVSSPLDYPVYKPVENCIVTIVDNTGMSEILIEKKPGIYVSSESGMQGTIGVSYKLLIVTPEGKEYQTEFQEMKPSVEIESIYAEEVPHGESVLAYPGYQFYLDSKMAQEGDNYFLWSMVETYQYTANYHIFNTMYTDSTLDYYRNVYRCWKTEKVKYFYTGKTTNLVEPIINGQPLHFVGTETKKLQEKYSVVVNQLSIGKESYDFWKRVEDQTSRDNILFQSQPYDIAGNVKNIKDPAELVYGNFTVASVTQKRIFVDPPRQPFYYDDACSINYDLEHIPYNVPTFLISGEQGIGRVFEECVNCTLQGGEINKPDFWIY